MNNDYYALLNAPAIGKVIQSIAIDDDRERLTIVTPEGESIVWTVDGDCCSASWIEHLTIPDKIVGAEITDIRDGGTIEVPSQDHECLNVYFTTIRTNRGEIVVEYRNSSNGYYGGSLSAPTVYAA